MLLRSIHPAIRLVIGVVVVAAGVIMHKVFLDVIGAAVVLSGSAQWLYRGRSRR